MATDDTRWKRLQAGPASVLSQWWMNAAEYLDRSVGWDKLPRALGLPTVIGLRERLQHDNLFDTGVPDSNGFPLAQCAYRAADGRWNDLAHPMMGAVETHFGRNVRPAQHIPESEPALLTPNPRTVSLTLLTRDRFLPATTLNMLAGAWLQFEIHDWFSHGTSKENPFTLPVESGDPSHGEAVVIERTRRGTGPGVFPNEDTHWWDGSQIYGSCAEKQAKVRDGARLKVEGDTIPGYLADDFFDFSGRHAGFWTGSAALHSLFALEHNAICEHLAKMEWRLRGDQEKLFQTARLVNAALMAKIHTTEWTPAIIAHPTTRVGMKMSWWGVSERLKRSIGRVSTNEAISGIPGSPSNHYGVPYSLTEEFAAVYRMHPLVPDDFVFRSPFGGTERRHMSLAELRTTQAIPVLRDVGMPAVLYTFGISHPGALTLHNYPRTLQEFDRGGKLSDLAATDILRDRERGVPRYNRFREAFHKAPVQQFDQLSVNPTWVEEMREVYDGDIDNVDLMIGLLAEPPPRGFGFSDTAFRVFLLMASRRLKSDRFFTDCYNEEHYTKAGLDWIDNNSMKTVLLRHFRRELEDVLEPIENAFRPWAPVAG
ncbi:MAG: peroxidase family protein [Pseudonocardiaceae bacterium]